jgi:predicted RNA-binding Zn-ribbon protein involved in translation (DUF1610 family)
MKEPKIILWDLETLPNLPQALKVWTGLGNYPGLTLRAQISSIICFGYKEFGRRNKTKVISTWDFPKRWNKDVNDDYEVCKRAYEILHDADLIVTHNGKRFDEKHLNTRLMLNGLPTLPPIAHADTCQLAKRLYFFNNRLNTLGEQMVGQKKVEHEGWDMWVKVHARNKKSCKEMAIYCAGDVDLLEKIFRKLRKYANNIPNHNFFTLSKKHHCPNCGSTRIRSLGFRYTKTNAYRRYICVECGTASHTNKKDETPRFT